MGAKSGGMSLQMDKSTEVKDSLYMIKDAWYRAEGHDRDAAGRVIDRLGKLSLPFSRNSERRSSKTEAWDFRQPMKQNAPPVTAPSQFYRSIMTADKAKIEKAIMQDSF